MIDITFDLETCAVCPTAAVMSVGAVAWNRNGVGTPFFEEREPMRYPTFSEHVDLRGMFVDGFAFDADTAKWWSERSNEAKDAVLDDDNEGTPCSPIQEVVKDFFRWIDYVKKACNATEVNLWCQGTDFDMAILRNICHKYQIEIPVSHKNFRDHRTFFMEGAAHICKLSGEAFEPEKAYDLVDAYEVPGVAHDPLYDCRKSIYSTGQMMKHLSCLPNHDS